MSSGYSDVRLYVRPLGQDVIREDLEDFFRGFGTIVDLRIMGGYAFVEFETPRQAEDIIGEFNNKDFMGERLLVEYARVRPPPREEGSYGRRDFREYRERREPRKSRRSPYRINVSELPSNVSWQDLKDFARSADVPIVYADVSSERDGTGVIDVVSEADLETAMGRLVDQEVKGVVPVLRDEVVDMSNERSPSPGYRRSPPRRSYGYDRRDDRGGRYQDEYPRRRQRSRSPRRDYYDDRAPPPSRGYRDSRGSRYGGRDSRDDHRRRDRDNDYGSRSDDRRYRNDYDDRERYSRDDRGGYDRDRRGGARDEPEVFDEGNSAPVDDREPDNERYAESDGPRSRVVDDEAGSP
ncbi:uncharacterized protein V1516DRAFT_668272 [Lipomyces oligophaga]|uniref:uncharacterized protein n=1 Tax=Lipomyces oligophaga TaxID=45792 RepID=UPI0034CF8A32